MGFNCYRFRRQWRVQIYNQSPVGQALWCHLSWRTLKRQLISMGLCFTFKLIWGKIWSVNRSILYLPMPYDTGIIAKQPPGLIFINWDTKIAKTHEFIDIVKITSYLWNEDHWIRYNYKCWEFALSRLGVNKTVPIDFCLSPRRPSQVLHIKVIVPIERSNLCLQNIIDRVIGTINIWWRWWIPVYLAK